MSGETHDIETRLRDAWRAIVHAEQARGAALAAGGDQGAAQEEYQAALVLFRRAQIDAFTATLGHIPLLRADIQALADRVRALEARAVGADAMTDLAAQVARLEARLATIAQLLSDVQSLTPDT